MKNFRWAYIGCGSIADKTAKSILNGNHTISAVYSRTFSKAQAFAEKYGAKAYNDFDKLLEERDFDAIYVATPHTTHVEYTLRALEKHIPVLCEKPMGISAQDVELLIKAARDNDTYLCEAMWTWFSDTAISVRRWVQEGKVGELKQLEIHHAFPGLSKKPDSRVRNPMTAGGALLDIGIYPITYCYNLFGYPDKITCEGTVRDGIDIKEKVTLNYGDARCELYMSFEYLKEKFTLKGTCGAIKMPLFHVAPYALLRHKGGISLARGKTTYLNEFDRCAEEIRQGLKQSRFVPLEATLSCMRIMDECRRQLQLKYPFEK